MTDIDAIDKRLRESVKLPVTVGEDRYGGVNLADADGDLFGNTGRGGDDIEPDTAAAIVDVLNAFGALVERVRRAEAIVALARSVAETAKSYRDATNQNYAVVNADGSFMAARLATADAASRAWDNARSDLAAALAAARGDGGGE